MERHSSAYHSHSYIHVFHTFIYKNCMNKHFLAFVVATCVCVCLCSVERLRSQDAMNGIVYVAHCRRTTLMPGVQSAQKCAHERSAKAKETHKHTHTHTLNYSHKSRQFQMRQTTKMFGSVHIFVLDDLRHKSQFLHNNNRSSSNSGRYRRTLFGNDCTD